MGKEKKEELSDIEEIQWKKCERYEDTLRLCLKLAEDPYLGAQMSLREIIKQVKQTLSIP